MATISGSGGGAPVVRQTMGPSLFAATTRDSEAGYGTEPRVESRGAELAANGRRAGLADEMRGAELATGNRGAELAPESFGAAGAAAERRAAELLGSKCGSKLGVERPGGRLAGGNCGLALGRCQRASEGRQGSPDRGLAVEGRGSDSPGGADSRA
jgi:hypothetical protein